MAESDVSNLLDYLYPNPQNEDWPGYCSICWSWGSCQNSLVPCQSCDREVCEGCMSNVQLVDTNSSYSLHFCFRKECLVHLARRLKEEARSRLEIFVLAGLH